MRVICGGGIRTGLDAAKAMMMGADAVSIAYPLLMALKTYGESGLYKEMEKLFYELKVSMIVSGAANISQLADKKIIITGKTLEWIEQG
jgi:isopentenyl-diphosphate delta-isomerase